ncbi:glycosyltransferase family 2 protein [Nocardioides lijunqiniae]|uniref:glycosyltransferase family 2 protein n=1 Tax=Nocardioides lijunqiniae TaxID=2760832 RepID=UPI001877D1FD|nr:galactosyltransferase-related protein [Nocardioides lijunqiniae]
MSATAVVTIVHGRRDHLALQGRSLARQTDPAAHVVVAMDDPDLEVPGAHVVHVPRLPLGLPLAAARNAGAAAALAEGADVLVFLDVDCLADPALLAAYGDDVRQQPGTVWSGPVTYLDRPPPGGYDLDGLAALDAPHPARPAPQPGELLHDADPDLFWSLSFACHADAWLASGGFCEDYVGYGGEDTDFGRTLVARGLRLGWTGSARAYHQWHPVSSPPVEHVDDIVRNAALFHRRWGEWPMGGWLDQLEQQGLVVRRDGAWAVAAEVLSGRTP